jgi:hypothetical protein
MSTVKLQPLGPPPPGHAYARRNDSPERLDALSADDSANSNPRRPPGRSSPPRLISIEQKNENGWKDYLSFPSSIFLPLPFSPFRASSPFLPLPLPLAVSPPSPLHLLFSPTSFRLGSAPALVFASLSGVNLLHHLRIHTKRTTTNKQNNTNKLYNKKTTIIQKQQNKHVGNQNNNQTIKTTNNPPFSA